MLIKHQSPSVRLTGRWNTQDENMAVTTAPGAYLEIAFKGELATLLFDTDFNAENFPHLYISVDGGPMIESVLSPFIHIKTGSGGAHTLKVIYKSSVEDLNRWYNKLLNKVTFLGLEADAEAPLAPDVRKTIEFIGDSITEGVLVETRTYDKVDTQNRVYQDDVTATYAWQTAELLNLRPYIMGYGAVGITKSGSGGVPKVIDSYPFNYENSPAAAPNANLIVINHGANDMGAPAEVYTKGYLELLDLVRSRNPKSKIVVLSAFCGAHVNELEAAIADYNKEKSESIAFINGSNWVPKEPLHPLRAGHKIIAGYLAEELKKFL